MQFLSSKLVHELEAAFTQILQHQRHKEGEAKLLQLRNERQFELAVATFISRSQDYHKKLLAVLQLQRRKVIQEVQTVWSLKQVYYRDNDKIANKIRKIISQKQNIEMASEFLVFDPSQAGSSVFRQIEIVFALLKFEDKAQCTLRTHLAALYQYFFDATSIIQSHEPYFFMLAVCFALFHQAVLKYYPSESSQLFSLWKRIQNKFSDSQIEGVFLIYYSMKMGILDEHTDYRKNTLTEFISMMFSKRNQISVSYFSKCFAFIGKDCFILSEERIREQSIEALVERNKNINREMQTMIRIYGMQSISVQGQLNQDNNQYAIKQVFNQLIQSIFTHHYNWLNQSYLKKLDANQALYTLLSIFNNYNSVQLVPIYSIISGLIQQTTQKLANYFLSNCEGNDQRDFCITVISFLTKYKGHIQLCQLPHIVDLFSKLSQMLPSLSPFCDTFLSQIWIELTFLQTDELVSFLQLQLQKVNEDQWCIRLERYQPLLRLAAYLQQSNSYFSNCPQEDSLLLALFRSHQIICQQWASSKKKTQFDIFHIFLQVTKAIIDNNQFKRNKQIYEALNTAFIIDQIQRHLFLNEDTGVIVAFHRYHSQTLLSCLQKQRQQKWEIDQLDQQYKISLYLAEIQLASSLIQPQVLAHVKTQLGDRVIQFLSTVSPQKIQKIKQARLWDKLQAIYGISRFIPQKMEIQTH